MTGWVRYAALVLALVAAAVFRPGPAPAAEPSGRFAVVSDIHFNPFDPPELAHRLVEADTADWPAIFAGIGAQTMSSFGADTNHALFATALEAIGRIAADTDFVLGTGDFLVHRFKERAADALGVAEDSQAVQTMASKTLIYVADALHGVLPGKPLILALGNNDSACGNYRIQPGGPFLATTADTVRRVLGTDDLSIEFDTSYPDAGYFALTHPTLKDTTILVLNDVIWSAKYEDTCAGRAGAPNSMLEWLESQLARARAAGERVWLVKHIPAGIDAFWTANDTAPICADRVVPYLKEPFASRFPALIKDYSDVILASFSGHTHHDSYRLTVGTDGAAHGVDKIVPAISPIYRQNPGFQIFSYDVGTGAPTDFETWILTNLETGSLSAPGVWVREYVFSKAYGLPDYSAASVAAMWQEITADGPARKTFQWLYEVSHGALSDKDLPAFACAIRYSDRAEYTACYCDR